MPDSDLRSFVTRSRALVDSSPPTTLGETRAWLVGPFLETLGWDVHGDSCAIDRTLEDTRLEYVCSVHGVPALFVAVEPFGESLGRPRAAALLETMAWTGVDRAIYTDGRDFLLLAGTTDAERHTCRLSSLSDHESAVAHYSRPTVGQHLEADSRESVARRLALERPALVDAITAELSSATEQGAAFESEFESAADRFLEQLVVTFSDGRDRFVADRETDAGSDVAVAFSETEISSDDDRAAGRRPEPPDDGRRQRTPSEGTASEESASADATDADSSEADADSSRTEANPGAVDGDSSPTEANPGGAESNAADAGEAAGDGETGTDGPTGGSGTETAPSPAGGGADRSSDRAADPADGSGDGEYVVRFFNERGSIGALGHSSSKHALVEAAEYLFDRGLSGVAVPWSPDDTDDARAVLNDSPAHPDGTPMAEPQQLSNGLYLETSGDDEVRAGRVEALVARAGLRAMLTGDWSRE